jgi:hypothetical protein
MRNKNAIKILPATVHWLANRFFMLKLVKNVLKKKNAGERAKIKHEQNIIFRKKLNRTINKVNL